MNLYKDQHEPIYKRDEQVPLITSFIIDNNNYHFKNKYDTNVMYS